MVKGVARRIIMVKSPDPKLFEQAMFLVREEALQGGSPQQLLKEAEQAANSYLHQSKISQPASLALPLSLSFFAGSVVASLLWSFFIFL